VHVKICGVTRVEDATRAVEAGASAIGLVFWKGSSRAIDRATAREIARAVLPLVSLVGVFVDARPDELVEIAADVGLSAVQLHGRESPEEVERVMEHWRVIRAIVPGDLDAGFAARWPRAVTLLVDGGDAHRRGGSGRLADWKLARALARERALILAGGLTPSNVGAAIRQVRPAGVDVSSGVESAPGVKDATRVRAFIAAARMAAAGATS
jgi:phosphoribosylanthranilate isomerase